MNAILLATTGVGGISAMPAVAQTASARRDFDIPAQPLAQALMIFGRQSGVQVTAQGPLTDGLRSAAVSGAMAPAEALSRLLMGTGLTFRFVGSNGVQLERAPQSADGAIQLGPVRVEGSGGSGVSNGSGLSRDPGATEGTGSYTTRTVTIGKMPTSLRETPQSVSVLTRQQMDDQNFTLLGNAMKTVTGVYIYQNDGAGLIPLYNARGIGSDSVQRDGVNTPVSGNFIELDLAIYDRVEVQRGVGGLFKGAGEPGVTINLVRKRALASIQVNGLVGIGSWSTLRGEADLTGPLTTSGNIRGRLIAVVEDRNSFLNNVEHSKLLAYGTLEFDVSEATTLSLGGAWQQAKGIYHSSGPAYVDGGLPNLPRSTSFAPDWARYRFPTTDLFLELEHQLASGGQIKASVRHRDIHSRVKFLSQSQLMAANGDLTALRATDQYRDSYRSTSADIFFDTPFAFAGGTHNLLLGADYQENTIGNKLFRSAPYPRTNVFTFDPNALPDPAFPARPDISTLQDTHQYGVYGQLRIKPVTALTLIGGARLTWYDSETLNRANDVTTQGPKASARFTPYAAAVLDISRSLSVYASYAQIFSPQTAMTVAGGVLSPRVGEQLEAGIKGEWFDGHLNASTALYQITDRNRALADTANPGFSIAAGKVRSRGVEAEISGQLSDQWKLSANYAYNDTKYVVGSSAETDQLFQPYIPKHTFNIWTNYQFADGPLLGLDVGAGLRVASDVHYIGLGVRVDGEGYAVGSFQIGYKLDERLKLSLNIDNVFDKTFYERVGTGANFYGAPRNFMLTLRGSY